ncbi:hypothetical protein RKD48_003983 [Streptomyces ambofaciens]
MGGHPWHCSATRTASTRVRRSRSTRVCSARASRSTRPYLLIRDTILFTDRRLILVDKQGITGKKTEYHSIPYRSITHFAVETAGHFDLDAELKIWLSGSQAPIQKTFTKGVDIYEVQAILTQFVAR